MSPPIPEGSTTIWSSSKLAEVELYTNSQTRFFDDRTTQSDWLCGFQVAPLRSVDAPLIEIEGAYQGMRGPKQEGYAMLATFCPFQDQALFVKMVGPAEQVAAQKENFVAFCQSLRPI